MIRHLEVMAEYDASPLWDRTPGSVNPAPLNSTCCLSRRTWSRR
jgi:hypothetical protein